MRGWRWRPLPSGQTRGGRGGRREAGWGSASEGAEVPTGSGTLEGFIGARGPRLLPPFWVLLPRFTHQASLVALMPQTFLQVGMGGAAMAQAAACARHCPLHSLESPSWAFTQGQPPGLLPASCPRCLPSRQCSPSRSCGASGPHYLPRARRMAFRQRQTPEARRGGGRGRLLSLTTPMAHPDSERWRGSKSSSARPGLPKGGSAKATPDLEWGWGRGGWRICMWGGPALASLKHMRGCPWLAPRGRGVLGHVLSLVGPQGPL